MEQPHDLLLSRWSQVKDKVQQRWNKITDDDLTRLSGRTEELAVDLAGTLWLQQAPGGDGDLQVAAASLGSPAMEAITHNPMHLNR